MTKEIQAAGGRVMAAPIVFMDTETTGLRPDDEVWDFAAIRRDPNGATSTWILHVQHDLDKAARLPEPFLGDHERRYQTDIAVTQRQLAIAVRELFAVPDGTPYDHRPHVVGAVPNFDTEHLARILRDQGHEIPWHHHLMDAETLAVGWLRGVYMESKLRDGDAAAPFPGPPWDSEALSRAVGVDPERFARHTALGDVQWAMAIYDRVMGGE